MEMLNNGMLNVTQREYRSLSVLSCFSLGKITLCEYLHKAVIMRDDIQNTRNMTEVPFLNG